MAFDPTVSTAFVVVGAAAQGLALVLARRPLRLLRAGERARGRVTDNEEAIVTGGRGSPRRYFLPIIAFTTNRGEHVSFKSASGGGSPLAKDTRVDLLYDPAKPKEAVLATFRHLWLFPLVTSLFGLPFLAAGIFGLL
jgi:hypothetical protein